MTTLATTLTCAALCLASQNAPLADRVSPPAPAESLSDAERIARLRRTIDTNRKLLEALTAELADPEGDYRSAEKWFQRVDGELAEKKKAARKLRESGQASDAGLETKVQALEKKWQLSRERFNLAIQERKMLQQKATALAQKIEQDEKALHQLTSFVGPPAPADRVPAALPEENKTAPSQVIAEPTATPRAAAPSVPREAAAPQTRTTAPPEAPAGAASRPSKELLQAREIARLKEAAAQDANARAEAIGERIAALRRDIELEEGLLQTRQRKADNAAQSQVNLEKELQKRLAGGAAEEPVQRLTATLDRVGQRLVDARGEVQASADRLTDLRAELQVLEAEHASAVQEASQKRHQADVAEKQVARLESPFAWPTIRTWLAGHGPRLLLIFMGMLGLHFAVKVFSRRLVVFMVRRGNRGSAEEGENRAQTLVGVFRNTASLAVLGGGVLMLLDEISIPIVPLMGGAAVAGLAVAFGAQNLIRDYFSGFMVLLEDQYGINDVVRIGSVSGQVENITLRVTVLRDMEGVVHFIPHGTITQVSNLTHGWSRAFLEIGVSYREDVDRVMEVLLDLGRRMRRDPAFGPLILEDPEMLGVNSFEDSAVTIRFFLKTKPLKQWPVKRELLRRIKHKFDELGIEIPYPHRTVYHRHEDDGADQSRMVA